jgi:pimeloyl-ACP methyl ester carboxylesterase
LKRQFLPINVVLCFVMISPLILLTNGSLNGASSQVSQFSEAPCMFKVPAGLTEGSDLICGYLTVPENHSDPNGPKIRLAVATIRSNSLNYQPDPLIMAQGGPGGSTIETYIQRLAFGSRLRSNRDIVLLEQRGTLHSEPALTCKELDQLTLDTLDKELSEEELAQMNLVAIQKCHDRLVGENIDLSAFDSLENADDIEDLRIAMGYDQINLYGVSYGTLLALHYMRRHPQHLRSVILDGVVPPQTNFILNSTKTIDDSLNHLFSACSATPDCNRTYPDLENVFFEQIKKLNEKPATTPMKDPDSGKTYNAVIDGDSFLNGISQMLYATSILPGIPKMIYDAKQGNLEYFGRVSSLFIFDRTLAYGMYYSVLCAEDADFTPGQQTLEGVDPVVRDILQRGPSDFLNACSEWNVKPLDDSVDLPVSSEVPTLLLSGAFDPVTPSTYALTVDQTLPNSYAFTIPNGGHGQAFEGECQDNIILAFLDDPSKQPESNCLSGIGGPDFYTSNNLVDLPVIYKMLNLDTNTVWQFIIWVGVILIMATGSIFIPLAALIRRLRRKPASPFLSDSPPIEPEPVPPLFSRLASWLAFINGLIAPAFLLSLIATLYIMVAANDNRLLFGLPGSARVWMILPPLVAILSLSLIIGVIQSWISKSWSIWMRLYLTLLGLSALTCTAILGIWGMLIAIIS